VEHHKDDPDKIAEAYNAHFLALRQLIELGAKGEIDKLYLGKVIARFRENYQEASNEVALKLPETIANDEARKELWK